MGASRRILGWVMATGEVEVAVAVRRIITKECLLEVMGVQRHRWQLLQSQKMLLLCKN